MNEEFINWKDLKENVYGPIGTKKRDEFEKKVIIKNTFYYFRSLRKDLNLNQKELAKIIGISVSQLAKFESGNIDTLSFGVIVKITNFFKIQIGVKIKDEFYKISP